MVEKKIIIIKEYFFCSALPLWKMSGPLLDSFKSADFIIFKGFIFFLEIKVNFMFF